MHGKRAYSTGIDSDDFKVESRPPRVPQLIAGCSSAWQSACFGNKRPQVQILSPRLNETSPSVEGWFH